MQRITLLVRIIGVILLMTAVAFSTATAQEVQLSVQVVSAGAVHSASVDDWMAGTLGQPIIGLAQIPEDIGRWGFWYEIPPPSTLGVTTPDRSVVSTGLRLDVVPNPADDLARIRYVIPSRGDVTLRIVDMLGRQVTVMLYNDQTGGEYYIEIPATTLPGGSFIVQLLHNGTIASQSLTVIH